MGYLALLSFLGGISGCSTFSGDTRLDGRQKDVPFQARQTDEPRKRIMVLPFLDENAGRSDKVRETARQALMRSMSRFDRFVFVSPSDLTRDPTSFIVNNSYNFDDMAKQVEGLGVIAIIEGKILDLKAQKKGDAVGLFKRTTAKLSGSVLLRVFSVKGNRELLNQVRSAEAEGETTRFADRNPSNSDLEEDETLVNEVVTKAFQGAVPGIVQATEKLIWEGRIAAIEGPRIYLNAGRVSGLQVGDLLKVTARGEEIYDPETGDFIGLAPGRMKGTLEVVSYFGTDGAICVLHSGSGFKENDYVELY